MADLDAPVRSTAALPPQDIAAWRPHAAVVSWSAVFAGAIAAAAFGLILLALGTGLGLAALSPWRAAGASAGAFGFAAIIWVCVTQILTSGLGGYLAGRLRHRWPSVETDEVYFRDTAHGFLAWALATLATAALVAAMLPVAEHAGVQAAAKAASSTFSLDRGDAQAAMNRWPLGYYVDSLFRRPALSASGSSQAQPAAAPAIATPQSNAAASAVSSAPAPAAASPSPSANANTASNANVASGAVVSPVATPTISATETAERSANEGELVASGAPPKREVARIFLNSVATGDALSVADIAYVARIVSQYTGLSPQAAQVRVAATYGQLQQKVAAMQDAAKEVADRARRASVSASLWLFVSLLLGAFSASLMAIFGGRLRDV